MLTLLLRSSGTNAGFINPAAIPGIAWLGGYTVTPGSNVGAAWHHYAQQMGVA